MGSVVIHVGQGKAASTSLQKALARRRSELDRFGVSYPDTGQSSHAAEAAWFATTHGKPVGTSGADAFRNNFQQGWQGDWSALVRSVETRPLTVISSEFFAQYGPSLAAAAVESLTGGRSSDVRVVIVARLMSRLLPSLYGQAARNFPLPSFETWVRLQMRSLISTPPAAATEQRNTLDSRGLARCWAPAAPVRVVDFDPPTGADFESDLSAALMLGDVLSPPFLGHANPGMCAARTIAWQRVLTRAGRPDKPSQMGAPVPFASLDDSVLPGGGGRFRLREEAALVIDAAFPRPSATDLVDFDSDSLRGDFEGAQASISALLLSQEPLTYIAGVDDDELLEGVEYCLRHIPGEVYEV